MFERVYFETNGQGLWSNLATQIDIEDIKITYTSDDNEFGELAVFFDVSAWDIDTDGLIYTDPLFLSQLNQFLAQHGLPNASYSEQGMQGDNYVSLDIDGEFISKWNQKFPELV